MDYTAYAIHAIFGGNKTTSDWFPKNCAPQSGPMGPKLGENHGIDVLQVRIAIPILSHGHVCVSENIGDPIANEWQL